VRSKTLEKGGERRNSFQTHKQLTPLHVRHFSGIPAGDVAVEGTGRVKHWKKMVVREETVFKTPLQLTAVHVRH